jgi:flagellar basal body rod protein FlgC
VEIFGIALQGLNRALGNFDQAATRMSEAAAPDASQPVDSVNLSDAALSLLSARNQFEANLKALATADGMAQRAIDLLA